MNGDMLTRSREGIENVSRQVAKEDGWALANSSSLTAFLLRALASLRVIQGWTAGLVGLDNFAALRRETSHQLL